MTQPELGCQEFYSGGGESYEGRLELKQQEFPTDKLHRMGMFLQSLSGVLPSLNVGDPN
jgi:hypothetical protein